MSSKKDTTTAPTAPDTTSKFPLLSKTHGSQLATVTVGTGPKQHTFSIHKQLLAQASPYFDRALNGPFLESTSNTLTLERLCPIAFEVLYQWLYSGKKLTIADFSKFGGMAEYYETEAWDQLFYLRLFVLGDETMVLELKIHAYERLVGSRHGFFSLSAGCMPKTNFLAELFNTETPQVVLQDYLVAYAAWVIMSKRLKDPEVWWTAFSEVSVYGEMVLKKLTFMGEARRDGNSMMVHPSEDVKFSVQKLFLERQEGGKAAGNN
jgi:hypothetical protein